MALAFAMGSELVISVLVCMAAGYYLGPYFGSAQWGAIIGSFLGIFVWVWRMISSRKYLEK